MPNSFLRLLTVLTGMIIVNTQVFAASVSAKTTITANIVPMSSLGLSNIDVPDKKLDTDIRKTETKANGVIIRTDLSNTEHSTKLKIDTYHNNGVAYDISVSPFKPLSDAASKKLNTSRSYNSYDLQKDTNRQEFEIEVRMKEPDNQDDERYSGTVEITVNYN